MIILHRTTLILSALVLLLKTYAAPTQSDSEQGISLSPLHEPNIERGNPIEQHEPDSHAGIVSNSLEPEDSQCYICFEEGGAFPRGGACNIDSIIEECRHQPPCTNNPDGECGHLFCKDCITIWKQTWENTQRSLPDSSRQNLRFHCPRCMIEKGCPLNAMTHNERHTNRLDAELIFDAFLGITAILLLHVKMCL